MSDDVVPETGVIVTIREGNLTYVGKIESVSPTVMWVTLHEESKAYPPPTAGAELMVWWRVGRGNGCLPVAFAGAFPRGELVLWRLSPLGKAEVVQRRRFVRVAHRTPVAAIFFGGPKSGSKCKGKMIDIGEGGIRCSFPKGDMQHGDVMELEFLLREEVWINGRVLRTVEGRDGQEEVVITFDEVTTQMADQVRKFVFAKERERRRRENLPDDDVLFVE